MLRAGRKGRPKDDRHLWPQAEGSLSALLRSMCFCGCGLQGLGESRVYRGIQSSTEAPDIWGTASEGNGWDLRLPAVTVISFRFSSCETRLRGATGKRRRQRCGLDRSIPVSRPDSSSAPAPARVDHMTKANNPPQCHKGQITGSNLGVSMDRDCPARCLLPTLASEYRGGGGHDFLTEKGPAGKWLCWALSRHRTRRLCGRVAQARAWILQQP